jgi:hypothetical protein
VADLDWRSTACAAAPPSVTRGLDWGVGHEVQILDGDRYHRTTRTTTTVLQTDPFDVAATFIRPLLRNLGYETLLDQTPGDGVRGSAT